MKKTCVALLPCVLLCLSFQKLKAQEADKDETDSKSYWQAGISYLSNSIYLGRKDSVKVPYLTPIIGYYDKSGFFVSGSLSYLLTSGQGRIDLFELEGGYTFSSKKLAGEIYAAKDFYSSESYSVKSEIKGSVNGSLSYDLGFIKPVIQAGIIFNTNIDYSLGIGLEHSFFAADDDLEITPSFLLNASTQNYYSSYYTKRRYSAKRKARTGNGAGATVSAYLPNASEFKIMDYEPGIPINYSTGNFIFNFSPTLAIPTNPTIIELTIKPVNGAASYTKTSTEKLDNTFYWSAGVTYNF